MQDSPEQRPQLSTIGVWLTAFAVIAVAVTAYQTIPFGLLPSTAATRMLFSPMALMLVPLFVLILAAAAVAFWLIGTYAPARAARAVWSPVVVAAGPLAVYGLMAGAGQGFTLQDLLQPTVLLLLLVPLLIAGAYAVRARRPSLLRMLGVQTLAFGFGMALYVACVILLGAEA